MGRRRRPSSRINQTLNLSEIIVLIFLVFLIGLDMTRNFVSPEELSLIVIFLLGLSCVFLVWVGWKIRKMWQEGQRWKNFRMSEIDRMSGIEFEQYVAKLLKSLGATKIELTPAQGDFGVDILYTVQGKTFAAQLKRQKGSVGLSALQQAFSGAAYYRADQSILITNSYLTNAAVEFAKRNNVMVVDRSILIEWVNRHMQQQN